MSDVSRVAEPLGDRILVRIDEQDAKSKGGIILTDSSKEKPVTGTVVSVGSGEDSSGAKVNEMLKSGDRVAFTKWAGNAITIEDEELYVMKISDVLLKFKK